MVKKFSIKGTISKAPLRRINPVNNLVLTTLAGAFQNDARKIHQTRGIS